MHLTAPTQPPPGPPTDAYRTLAVLLDRFLRFCEEHDLPVCLAGDLPACWQTAGYLLPGAQDIRFCLPAEYWEQLQNRLVSTGWNWAAGSSSAPTFRIQAADTPDFFLHIDRSESRVPVSETLFMGYRLFVPAGLQRPEAPLAPLRPLKEVHTDAEIAGFDEPFVYRRFPWFPPEEAFFEAQLTQEPEVFGYAKVPLDNGPDWDLQYLPGARVWSAFQQNALPINVVDSECSRPEPLFGRWQSAVLPPPPSVAWVLTNAYKVTYFHVDPDYGGGYMYLCRGKKIWYFIAPDDLACLERRHGFERINRLPLPELLELDQRFLWGKLRVGLLGSGDFLYFPDNWAHFVRTLEHSFGYGGYFGHGQNDS